MVAIVSGNGLGLERSSARLTGSWGQLGSAFLGRGDDGVFVNATNGNLVIQDLDEVLIGAGPDSQFFRTYNSLGNYTNLDGSLDSDEWLQSTQRKMVLSGTANQAGSTITLTDWDGTQAVFAYDSASTSYKSTEKPYIDDVVTVSGTTISWAEGQSRLVQTFSSSIGGRIVTAADADGNTISYTYDLATTAGKLTRVTTQNSTGSQFNYTDLGYTSGKLTSLATSYYDAAAGINKTLTRVTYGYDTANRLSLVTVDLTPENAADSSTYTTTYGYKDATSKLVTLITQTDGTNLAITYDTSNRVQYLDLTAATGAVRRTSFSYDTTNRVTTITDPMSNVYKMTFDSSNRMTKLEEPAPVAGGNATFRTYDYNSNGDVTRVLTFKNASDVGNAALAVAYEVRNYDALGNLIERVDGANNSVIYTYGTLNEVLTETHYTGFDSDGLANGSAPAGAMTIHYVYDAAGNGVSDDGSASGDDAAEKHLRFRISGEGRVTEFRYNALGQLTAQIDYAGTLYSAGTWTEAALASWVSSTADKSLTQRTDYAYDFRGNIASAKSFASTDSAGNGLVTADYSQMIYVYDQFGKLRSKLTTGYNSLGGEPTAVAETFVYDGLGRMISATDALGLTTATTYNDAGRTTAISAPNRATRTLGYNIAGELLSDSVSGSGITTATTNNAYDALGRLRVSTDPAGNKTYFVYDRQSRLAATIAANGAMVEYTYDAADRVVAQVAYSNLVSSANLTALANGAVNTEAATVRPTASANDRWAWTVYDRAGEIVETIDAIGAATAFEYDGAGRLVRTTRYANAIAAGSVTGFKTTPPTSAVLPSADATNDRVTRSFYDNDGRLAATLDAEKFLTEYVYDKAGRLVETIGYWNLPGSTYLANGTLAQIKSTLSTNAKDVHAYTLYDGVGRVGARIDGEGNVTRYHYSVRGLVDQEVRGQQVAANTSYTLATLPAATGTLEVTRLYYNAAGLVTSKVQQLSSGNLTTTYTYNTKGELISTLDADGSNSTVGYDQLGRTISAATEIGVTAGTYATTTYEYDTRGNLVKVTDARNNPSYNYYDSLNRLVLAIDAEGYATKTTYNTFGEIASVTRYYNKATGTGNVAVLPGTPTDSRDETTTFTRDLLGRVTTTTDAQGASECSQFNALGDRTQVTNKLSGATTYTYDRMGRVKSAYVSAAIYNSSGTQTASGYTKTANTYDSFGNLVQQVEAQGLAEQRITYFTYDRAGRLTQKQLPSIAVYNVTTGAETLTARYENYAYDSRGNLTQITDAAGGRTLFYYDQANRKIAEINAVGTHKTYTYDANGNVTVERIYSTATALPGTPGGTPPSPSGTPREVWYSYDRNDRLIEKRIKSIQTGQLSGTTLVTSVADLVTAFTYDAAGNLVKETDPRGNSVYHYYDKNGRESAKVDQEGYLTTWTRDTEGNVTEERRYATQWGSTPVIGTVPGVPTSASDRVTQFTYDRMGHRLTEKRLAVAIGTVSGASISSSTQDSSITYTYNALGEVLTKVEATGDTTTYQYDSYGRMTRRLDQAFTDFNGGTVRLSDEAFYDGLDNLVYEKQSDYNSGGDIHITRYNYGDGGVLKGLVDPTGPTRNYFYSIKGEDLLETVWTTRSDGSTSAGFYVNKRYDAVGRVVTEFTADYDSSIGERRSLYTQTTYNTFGEVVSRGVGPEGSPTTVEQIEYDAAGRVVKSNAGDGIWKFFVYDANGNVTLTMTSTAAGNLAATSAATVLSGLTGGSGSIALGSLNQSAVTASLIVYDKRNLAVQTYEPNRTIANAADVATTTTQTLDTQRWYNAFGEVVQEKSARGYYSNYAYNNMGRVIQAQMPEVDVTGENGVTARARPTENYAYDISGRLVGVQNANGFWTTRVLLAGSGYGKEDALVTTEYRPDSSTWQTKYDVYRNARRLVDGLGRTISQDFDAAGRLTKRISAAGLTDEFAYDALGHRIRHWNNAMTSPIYGQPEIVGYGPYGEVYYGPPPVIGYTTLYETTDYDSQGRVTKAVNFAGDVTSYSYTWNGTTATTNLGTYGAWTKSASYATGKTSAEVTDAFGRMIGRTDLGGHTYTFTYNAAGQLANSTSSAGQNVVYTYYNTGRVATTFDNSSPSGYTAATVDGTYTYDADGNRTYEKLVSTTYWYDSYYGYGGTSTVTNQEGKGTYDEMGRLTTFTDAGASGNGAVSVSNLYDAAGNVRRTLATHYTINNNQTLGGQVTEDYWYLYDSLNRMTLVKGDLVGGAIVRLGADARTITYDAAGERASESKTVSVAGYYDPYVGYYPGYTYESRENFNYNADGLVTQVYTATGAQAAEGTVPPSAGSGGTLKAETTYDLVGRITDYKEYGWGDGTTVTHNRYSISYDARGSVLSESTTTKSGGYTNYVTTTNSYAAGGVLSSTYSSNYRYNSSNQYQGLPSTSTTFTYQWWDGPQQSGISYNDGQGHTYNTTLYYDPNGHLTSAYIGDGRPRSVSYVTDATGQILSRQELDNTSNGDPKQVWWFFDGKQVGTTGNNGNSDPEYEQAIAERTYAPGNGPFRNGATYGTQFSDFDINFNSLSPGEGGGMGSSYTVRNGDTLAGLAKTIFGDASLWYLIADANGLTGASQLVAGQQLRIPTQLANVHNTSDTFRPYDAARSVGDVMPTNPAPPPPPKKKGCGIFGQILMFIISAAIMVIAPFGTGFLGTIANAVVGSVASQLFGLATGTIDKFSFKSVALAGITAGVGFGLDKIGFLAGDVLGSQFLGTALRAATANAITQGLGVATGLQDRFDWAGVAAAGIGAGVAQGFGKLIGAKPMGPHTDAKTGLPVKGDLSFSNIALNGVAGMAANLARAATRSVIDGSDFGDNVLSGLPETFGTLIGSALGGAVANAHLQRELDELNKIKSVLDQINAGGEAEPGDLAKALKALSPADKPGRSGGPNAARPNYQETLRKAVGIISNNRYLRAEAWGRELIGALNDANAKGNILFLNPKDFAARYGPGSERAEAYTIGKTIYLPERIGSNYVLTALVLAHEAFHLTIGYEVAQHVNAMGQPIRHNDSIAEETMAYMAEAHVARGLTPSQIQSVINTADYNYDVRINQIYDRQGVSGVRQTISRNFQGIPAVQNPDGTMRIQFDDLYLRFPVRK